MIKNISAVFYSLATLGVVDFVVQSVTNGEVRLIRSFLTIIFGEA